MANNKRKRKGEAPIKKLKVPTVLSQSTIRNPQFFYLHLSLVSPAALSKAGESDESPDELTSRRHLTAALEQFLGITGTAIPVDILKCEDSHVWIRVPNEDGSAVIEALSGWVGDHVAWRIHGSGAWLGGLALGDGRDLFDS